MRLATVTLAGVDESVSARELATLSKAYPFVEWGVLISGKREGLQPRYPSLRWREIAVHSNDLARLRLSAHLCGNDASRGRCSALQFDRMQLNGVVEVQEVQRAIASATDERFANARARIIAQARDVAMLESFLSSGITTLYDASGGEGVSPSEWPVVTVKHESESEPVVGFAGGIGPKNIKQVLTELCAREGDQPFWVDMESSLRIDNNRRFSLEIAEQVLEISKPFVAWQW